MNKTYENVNVVVGTPTIADSGAGTDVAGSAIDRANYSSAIMSCNAGALTGGGALSSATFRLQESDASGSGFADCSPAISGTIVADSVVNVDVNLVPLKRYVRIVTKCTMSAGTCPLSTVLVLGEPRVQPV